SIGVKLSFSWSFVLCTGGGSCFKCATRLTASSARCSSSDTPWPHRSSSPLRGAGSPLLSILPWRSPPPAPSTLIWLSAGRGARVRAGGGGVKNEECRLQNDSDQPAPSILHSAFCPP